MRAPPPSSPVDARVRPLEPAWRAHLDALARARGWPASDDARLPAAIAELSATYNAHRHGPAKWTPALLGARLHFFFVRDVPKGAGAVHELLEAGAVPDRPLRVLDLGAGMGATGIGAARALRAAGFEHPVELVALDRDATALSVAAALAPHVPGLRVTTRTADVAGHVPERGYDLVLVGQTLCELDPADAPEARADRHARWLAAIHAALPPDGALVVAEPALREPTRHLMRVRDRLAGSVPIFAPCLHAGLCPMLRNERDWCHAHLPVDLPEWLAPVARAAGLRFEGLTFAPLVLAAARRAPPGSLRVVSEPLVSKGRKDAWLCGALPDGPGIARLGRQDRHATGANAAWDALGRGDVLAVDPLGPIGPGTRIERR